MVVGTIGISGFALSEPAFAIEENSGSTITVLVDNYSQAAPGVLTAAEYEAGLQTVWLDCPLRALAPAPPGFCQKAPEATDLRLRILSAPIRNTFQDSVFGFTVHSVLASVYYEYAVLRAKSDDAEFEVPIILGCVIAHELGHLLLGSNGHSRTGIMEPRWEPKQVRQLMMGRLLFTPEQSKLMRAQARTRMMVQMGKPDPGLIPLAD